MPRSAYVDPEVLSLTQQAKQLGEMRPDGVGTKMHTLLSRALDLDPDYVPALEWLISVDYFRWEEGLVSYTEIEERYEWIKSRILEADPDNSLVDAMDAWTFMVNGEYEEAAALHLRGLSRDLTDSNAVRLAAVFARRLGRLDTSIQLLKHAVAIDPLCFMCIYQLSRSYLYAGNYELALAARERFLTSGTGGMYHYGLMLLLQGEAQDALDYYLAQQDETSQEVAAWMGRDDRAFKLLNEIAVADPSGARGLVYIPLCEILHNDPRWDTWLDSIGMSAERLDAIDFNPNLPE